MVFSFTLIRSLLDRGDTTAARLLSLLERLRFALDPDDRFEELLFTFPLLLLFDDLRFTVPLLRLLEEDRFLFTEPLLLLFVLLLLTVPLERFVFVRERFTVDRLFVRLDAFDRIALPDRFRVIVLRLRFTCEDLALLRIALRLLVTAELLLLLTLPLEASPELLGP